MNPLFHLCTIDDLATLQTIASQTFRETFAAHNTQSDMQAYIKKAFDEKKLRMELLNTHSRFYLVYLQGQLVGYLKLNEGPAQTEAQGDEALEIERIYIIQALQDHGLGKQLMDKAIQEARAQHKRYIWLGVWEKNKKAIAFYSGRGFQQVGTHSFLLGSDMQTDFIMRKDLKSMAEI